MKILGINIDHDTSSTLIDNGKVVAACEQERYNKKKHTREFPVDAINDCLKIGKIKIADINVISVGFLPTKHIRDFYLKPSIEDPRKVQFIIDQSKSISYFFNFEKIIREKLKYKNVIEYNNHHYCHLASTFYPSGFDKNLVIVLYRKFCLI